MATAEIWISATPAPCLERIRFHRDGESFLSVRGKTGGAYGTVGTFQWTSAVQALLILLLRHKLYGNSQTRAQYECVLAGTGGTPASSLDYAIAKEPVWIQEMFGSDMSGRSFAARLFQRTNPHRKRPGPVIITVHPQLLPAEDLVVHVDEKVSNDSGVIKAVLSLLESGWRRCSAGSVSAFTPQC